MTSSNGPEPQTLVRGGRLVKVDPAPMTAMFPAPAGSPASDALSAFRAIKDSVNTDPPAGVPVIQGLPDGSTVVLPLSYFGSFPGYDDAGSLNAASQQNPAGTIRLADPQRYGSYQLASTWVPSPIGHVEGNGAKLFPTAAFASTAGPAGTANVIYWHDLSDTPPQPPNPTGPLMGSIRRLIVDGSQLVTAANLLHFGDGEWFELGHVELRNALTAGCVGLVQSNDFKFTEKALIQAALVNNDLGFLSTTSINKPSMEYCDWYFYLMMPQAHEGLEFNESYTTGSSLTCRGNVGTATPPATLSTAALTITGASVDGTNPHILRSRVEITLEGTSGNPPQTILFGASNNSMTDCFGNLAFENPPGGSPAWVASNAVSGQFTFGGVINGDATLTSVNAKPNGWL